MIRCLKTSLAVMAMVLAATSGVEAADADAYPTKAIRLVVAATPGGLLDIYARMAAQKMSEKLGQPMIVENRPGADGLLGIRYVKSAQADGYTLLATTDTVAILPVMHRDAGYDLAKDFDAIGPISRSAFVLATATTQPDKTFAEFVVRAKAHPGILTFASGGVGTSTHLPGAMMAHQLGLSLLHVPYKGNAAAMADVMGGRINVIFAGAQQLRTGKLRALGVGSFKRLPVFPDVPTLQELGVKDFSAYIVVGILAPAGTPKDAIRRLSQALKEADENENSRRIMLSDGSEPLFASPEDYASMLAQTSAQTRKIVTDLKLPIE